MSEAALKALDEALYEVSGGVIVRGGALTASPDERVRRRIRVFKRLEAEHGDVIEKQWDDEVNAAEFGIALAEAWDKGRPAALEDMFAAIAAKTGSTALSAQRVLQSGGRKVRRSPSSPRLRRCWTNIRRSYL